MTEVKFRPSERELPEGDKGKKGEEQHGEPSQVMPYGVALVGEVILNIIHVVDYIVSAAKYAVTKLSSSVVLRIDFFASKDPRLPF